MESSIKVSQSLLKQISSKLENECQILFLVGIDDLILDVVNIEVCDESTSLIIFEGASIKGMMVTHLINEDQQIDSKWKSYQTQYPNLINPNQFFILQKQPQNQKILLKHKKIGEPSTIISYESVQMKKYLSQKYIFFFGQISQNIINFNQNIQLIPKLINSTNSVIPYIISIPSLKLKINSSKLKEGDDLYKACTTNLKNLEKKNEIAKIRMEVFFSENIESSNPPTFELLHKQFFYSKTILPFSVLLPKSEISQQKIVERINSQIIQYDDFFKTKNLQQNMIKLNFGNYFNNSKCYPFKIFYETKNNDNEFDEESSEIMEQRKKYHQLLLLPEKPFLRYYQSIQVSDFYQSIIDSKLKNVHSKLKSKENFEESNKFIVKGDYVYFHYLQDGMDDNGWGCAYRSLQTLLSHLILNGYDKINQESPIPSHYEIQKALVEMGDKSPSFLESTQWIGAYEVMLCIQHFLKVESKILNISSGLEIVSLHEEFINHFQNEGTPIMIGGGVLAYTLLGIDVNSQNKLEAKYLILDPHYTGKDNLKTILQKGWCQWKSKEIFKPEAFYNFCMPQLPNMI